MQNIDQTNLPKKQYKQLNHTNASCVTDQDLSTIHLQVDHFNMLNPNIITPQYQDTGKTSRSEIPLPEIIKSGLQILDTVNSIIVREKSDVGTECIVENQKFIYAANNMELVDESIFQCVEMSSCLVDCLTRFDFIILNKEKIIKRTLKNFYFFPRFFIF